MEKQLFSRNTGTQCAWLRRGMKYRRKKGCKEEPLCIPAGLLRKVIQDVLGRHKLLSPAGQSGCERKDTQHSVGGRCVDLLIGNLKKV